MMGSNGNKSGSYTNMMRWRQEAAPEPEPCDSEAVMSEKEEGIKDVLVRIADNLGHLVKFLEKTCTGGKSGA